MKNFLLNPLRISIIVLHLQRQTNKDNKKRWWTTYCILFSWWSF